MFTLSQELFCSPHHSTREKAWDHMKLEGGRARRADPHWSKGYSVLHGVVLVDNLGRKLARGCCLRTGWPPFAGWRAIALCVVLDILFHLSILMLFFPLQVWSFKTLKTVVISAPKHFLFFLQFCPSSHWVGEQMTDCVIFSYLPG